jgi:hypothetical protein
LDPYNDLDYFDGDLDYLDYFDGDLDYLDDDFDDCFDNVFDDIDTYDDDGGFDPFIG